MKLSPLPEGKRSALLMGVLTALFCLLVADGLLGLQAPNDYLFFHYALPGTMIFWFALIGLPLAFRKTVKWRDTTVNLFLIFVLYFVLRPIPGALGIWRHSKFLRSTRDGLIEFPGQDLLLAAFITVLMWGVQAAILLALEKVTFWRKSGGSLSEVWRKIPSEWKYGVLMGMMTDFVLFGIADWGLGLNSLTGKLAAIIGIIFPPILFCKKVNFRYAAISIVCHIFSCNFVMILVLLGLGNHTMFDAIMGTARDIGDPTVSKIVLFGAILIWLMQGVVYYFILPRKEK